MARFAQGPPAHLWIAVLISLSYSCFTWFLRIYARVGYYGIDDIAITIAHVTALAQWASLIVALNNGLGEPEAIVGHEHLNSMARTRFLTIEIQAVVASQIFYLLTMGLTNLSLTLLMRRIFSTNTKHKIGSYILLGVISAWLVLAVAAVKSNCPSTHILEGQEHTCPNDIYRWRAIFAITICIEAAVMGLPIYLQENACRLSLCVSNAVCELLIVTDLTNADLDLKYDRLVCTIYEVRSDDRSHHFSKVIVWQQASICYSLLSATLPFVQAFMRSFTTGGTAFGSIIYGSRNSRSNSSGDTSRSRSRNESFTPQFLGRTRTVCRGAGKQTNNEAHRASGGSQELIVRREVTVAVTQN
ncbi:hypothetical protein D6C93_00283 [Aureobasidium pullulans]|nr:hypothetical protein D6C93_00283 [Aureobasidium pullulans]